MSVPTNSSWSTLKARLSKEAWPIEKAVEYAAQILNALEAAHQKGITPNTGERLVRSRQQSHYDET
jgi:hypothetical protein